MNELIPTWEQNQQKQIANLAAKQILSRLTKRERQVLYLMTAGYPNKIIAYNLHISLRTAENHRSRIMDKTGCKSLSSLISIVALGNRQCITFCLFTKTCLSPQLDCKLRPYILNNSSLRLEYDY